MDQFTITSVSCIITIINGFHAISERVKRMHSSTFIKTTLVCFSFFFIKQIITFGYRCQVPLFAALMSCFICRTISMFFYYSENKILEDDNMLISFVKDNTKILAWIFIVMISLFFHYPSAIALKDLVIENFSIDKTNFIDGLYKYQSLSEIFIYLRSDIFLALCIGADIVNIFITLFAMLYVHEALEESIQLKCCTSRSYRESDVSSKYLDITMDKMRKLSWISLLISSGVFSYMLKQIFY